MYTLKLLLAISTLFTPVLGFSFDCATVFDDPASLPKRKVPFRPTDLLPFGKQKSAKTVETVVDLTARIMAQFKSRVDKSRKKSFEYEVNPAIPRKFIKTLAKQLPELTYAEALAVQSESTESSRGTELFYYHNPHSPMQLELWEVLKSKIKGRWVDENPQAILNYLPRANHILRLSMAWGRKTSIIEDRVMAENETTLGIYKDLLNVFFETLDWSDPKTALAYLRRWLPVYREMKYNYEKLTLVEQAPGPEGSTFPQVIGPQIRVLDRSIVNLERVMSIFWDLPSTEVGSIRYLFPYLGEVELKQTILRTLVSTVSDLAPSAPGFRARHEAANQLFQDSITLIGRPSSQELLNEIVRVREKTGDTAVAERSAVELLIPHFDQISVTTIVTQYGPLFTHEGSDLLYSAYVHRKGSTLSSSQRDTLLKGVTKYRRHSLYGSPIGRPIQSIILQTMVQGAPTEEMNTDTENP